MHQSHQWSKGGEGGMLQRQGGGEAETIYTTREGKVVKSHSFCCVVNSKGKLEVVDKVWTTFENDDAEVEVITTWEAERD